jgi:uncharacterized protein (DUF1697 family)
MRFFLFLRGINVGGNKKVPMGDLKKALEKAGFNYVMTLLNSGNVVLESDETADSVRKISEEAIRKKFGFDVSVIVRTADELQELADTDPYAGIKMTTETRQYVSFLSAPTKSTLKIPYTSKDMLFKILKVDGLNIISIMLPYKTMQMKTVDAMAILEKEYGKGITTRNWNTVEKLLKL